MTDIFPVKNKKGEWISLLPKTDGLFTTENWWHSVYKSAALNGSVKAQRYWLRQELWELTQEEPHTYDWYLELADVYGCIVGFDLDVDIFHLIDHFGQVPFHIAAAWYLKQQQKGRRHIVLPPCCVSSELEGTTNAKK